MRLSDIKQRIRVVKDLLDGPPGPDAHPLEIRAAVVDAIEGQVETLGIGRRAFPYNQIAVRLLIPAKGEKAPLERVFADLEARLRERLREVRCPAPSVLDLSVGFVKKAPADWVSGQLFSIEYAARADSDAVSTAASIPLLRVTVLKGTATKKAYAFREPAIRLGRTIEVRDSKGRVRMNHVAFSDEDSTVSRAHAKLTYDRDRREYRLLDDGSARGTRIMRGGTTIAVPRDPRGVRLQSGDEIQLGDAAVRVLIG